MLKGAQVAKFSLAVFITDTLYLISYVHSFSFSFVCRDCNRVAHVLTKHALNIELPATWKGNFSNWVCRENTLDTSYLQLLIK